MKVSEFNDLVKRGKIKQKGNRLLLSSTEDIKIDSKKEKKDNKNFSKVKKEYYQFTFRNLPKISVNKFFSQSITWKKRQEIKQEYIQIIKNETDIILKDIKCIGFYDFYFKKRPLDSMNTSIMAKMIEDILIPKDEYNKVLRNCLSSDKSDTKYDYVNVTIQIL